MKVLEKITLIIYSCLILILSIIVCLVIFNWLNLNIVHALLTEAFSIEIVSNILLIISVIFILLSIKCIFFSSSESKEKMKQGILLQNENGKLMITQDTLESLVKSVVKGFESAEVVSTRIEIDKENNVIIYVNLTVTPNAVIKELSTNLQARIKETIKKMADLEVKEVNIGVKNVIQNNAEG